jgi:hypothetical protein
MRSERQRCHGQPVVCRTGGLRGLSSVPQRRRKGERRSPCHRDRAPIARSRASDVRSLRDARPDGGLRRCRATTAAASPRAQCPARGHRSRPGLRQTQEASSSCVVARARLSVSWSHYGLATVQSDAGEGQHDPEAWRYRRGANRPSPGLFQFAHTAIDHRRQSRVLVPRPCCVQPRDSGDNRRFRFSSLSSRQRRRQALPPVDYVHRVEAEDKSPQPVGPHTRAGLSSGKALQYC